MRAGSELASGQNMPEALDRDWPAVAASAVGLVFSVGTILLYSFGVFIRPLTHTFHWSRTEVSAAVTVSQYAFAFTSPVWGFLIDRFGPRRVVLPCVLGLSLGVASLALLTHNLWQFYLTFAVIPLLGGGASPLGYAAVLVRRFDRHLGLALGLALMGVGLGAALLSPFSQHLVENFGWRHAYAILGGITLLVTLPAAMVATSHAQGPALRRAQDTVPALIPAIRSRAFLLMCLIFILLGAVTVGMLAHLVPMMTDRGFTPGSAARVAGLTGLAAIVGRGGLGWVLDRVHAPHVLAAVCVLAGAAFVLFAYGGGRPVSLLAAVLLGLVVGAEVDFIAYFTRRYFEPAAFGRLYGLAFGLFILGSGTGPLLLGISFDHLGGYRPGLLLFALLCFISAAITFAMPRYSSPRSQGLLG